MGSRYGETAMCDVLKGPWNNLFLHKTIRYGLRLKLSDTRKKPFQSTRDSETTCGAEVE